MVQGLLILTAVLTVVLMFNFFAIRLHKIPAHKGKKLRKIFLIVYGISMISVGVAFIFLEENAILGWCYILIGIGFPMANGIASRNKNL